MTDSIPTGSITGESAAIKEIRETIAVIAPSDESVLVLGEKGNGQHLREPDDLLETQLFGHEEGAFTGAGRKRHGWLKTADRGKVAEPFGGLRMSPRLNSQAIEPCVLHPIQ